MAAPKLYQKVASNAEKDNQWYSFFWAASFMASLCIIAVLLCEILAAAVTDTPTVIHLYMNHIKTMVIIKLAIMLGLVIPLDILIACYIIFKSEKGGFLVPKLVHILSFPLCCTCFCYKDEDMRLKWIQTLALTSLLLFTQLVALSAHDHVGLCISHSRSSSNYLLCCSHFLYDSFNNSPDQNHWTH